MSWFPPLPSTSMLFMVVEPLYSPSSFSFFLFLFFGCLTAHRVMKTLTFVDRTTPDKGQSFEETVSNEASKPAQRLVSTLADFQYQPTSKKSPTASSKRKLPSTLRRRAPRKRSRNDAEASSSHPHIDLSCSTSSPAAQTSQTPVIVLDDSPPRPSSTEKDASTPTLSSEQQTVLDLIEKGDVISFPPIFHLPSFVLHLFDDDFRQIERFFHWLCGNRKVLFTHPNHQKISKAFHLCNRHDRYCCTEHWWGYSA